MTQNQSLLLTYKAKALLAVDGGTWGPGHQYIDPNFRGDWTAVERFRKRFEAFGLQSDIALPSGYCQWWWSGQHDYKSWRQGKSHDTIYSSVLLWFRLNWFKSLVRLQSIWRSNDTIPSLLAWSKIPNGNYPWSLGVATKRELNWWTDCYFHFDHQRTLNEQHPVKASGTLEWHHSMILLLVYRSAFTTVKMKISTR